MNSLAELAEHYRKKAADLKKRSERAGSDIARDSLLEAARTWDDLAERCDAEIAAYRGRI